MGFPLTDAANHDGRKAEERQALLIGELNHRIRNIFALIQSIVSQSRRLASDPYTMTETLDYRIQALARAHDQLTADRIAAASLTTLIEVEASAFLGARHDRVHTRGKEVKLVAAAFTIMALIVHELVTNAAKYGALSENGRVDIDWDTDASGDLHIRWREIGGPLVVAPMRRGFGSTMIERALTHELGGRSEIRYAATGVEADFKVPARYVVRAISSHPDILLSQPKTALDLTPLKNKSVLLVEDSLIIALECEATLIQLGAREVHTTSSVSDAQTIHANYAIDLALLDYNLGTETSIALADRLVERSIPVIFSTGYDDSLQLPPTHRAAKILVKPYTTTDLSLAVSAALARR